MMSSTTYFVLAVSCLVMGANGSWSLFDPFEDIFSPSKAHGNIFKPSSSAPVATNPPATPGEKTSPTDSSAAEDEMRRIIQQELNKYKNSGEKEDTAGNKAQPSAAVTTTTSTENPADMIRRIIAEELAKVLPPNIPVSTEQPSTPPPPVWKSWANTKYWAKQPGPNGEAPSGFIGTLQNRFGPPAANGGYNNAAAAAGGAHPAGSPGWVWSQIASKWANSDPTIVPPAQIVDNGAWEIVLPPQSSAETKSKQ